MPTPYKFGCRGLLLVLQTCCMCKRGKSCEMSSHFSVARAPVLTCEIDRLIKGVGYYPRIISMFEGFQNITVVSRVLLVHVHGHCESEHG